LICEFDLHVQTRLGQ